MPAIPELLQVEDLRVVFPGMYGRPDSEVVRGVSFSLNPGECLALVGESGCGKSITSLALTALPPTDKVIVSGSVRFQGRELVGQCFSALREIRGHGISYVFQDATASLNPVLRIDTQLFEAMPSGYSKRKNCEKLVKILSEMGFEDPARVMKSYPHELSGGMQQRVMIAMAAAAEPDLIITDEPTTALDVTTQMEVLMLIDGIRHRSGTAWLFITHNLGLVSEFADKIAVMYAGQVVETGPVKDILRSPAHPYTKGLLAAVPRLDYSSVADLSGIPGRVPLPSEWPAGCAFAGRCSFAGPECSESAVGLREISSGRCVRCLHPVK